MIINLQIQEFDKHVCVYTVSKTTEITTSGEYTSMVLFC